MSPTNAYRNSLLYKNQKSLAFPPEQTGGFWFFARYARRRIKNTVKKNGFWFILYEKKNPGESGGGKSPANAPETGTGRKREPMDQRKEGNAAEDRIVRSPFFYVGDKYKLMPQLKQWMPERISRYAEPFAGGGSSFLNACAEEFLLNDVDEYVIKLHRAIGSFAWKEEELFGRLYELIGRYGLSCSCRGILVPEELKRQYVKTYYSRYNKEAYLRLRDDFNGNQEDLLRLYLLLIYGFNHMIRFNRAGQFNLPVGNVDFNFNVEQALKDYLAFCRTHAIQFFNMDYQDFLNQAELDGDSYVFLDPPYLISMSEYNKLWNEQREESLCRYLDELDRRGVRFGITNLLTHKGRVNETFARWSERYTVYDVKSNYISYHDNTIKAGSREVFVTNYRRDG